jgi:hypothetical protein
MKTKPILNLTLIILGILVMSVGPGYLGKEFALALGFPILMWGLYRVSKVAQPLNEDSETNSDEI